MGERRRCEAGEEDRVGVGERCREGAEVEGNNSEGRQAVSPIN